MANGVRHPGSIGIRRPDRSVQMRVPVGFGVGQPLGARRPDRLADLRSQPAQQAGMGGGFFQWGGYGNPPAIWRRGPGGPSWSLTSNAESRRFIAAVAEQMRREGKDMPPPGSDPGSLVGPVYEYLGKSSRYIALPSEGGIVDDVPEPGPEAAVDPEPDPQPEWVAPDPDAGNLLSQGVGALGGALGGVGGFLGDALSARQSVPTALPHAQAAQSTLGGLQNMSNEQRMVFLMAALAAAASATPAAPLAPYLLGGGAALGGMP